jgi:hypothetical protein
MTAYIKYVLFVIIICQSKILGFATNNSCAFFDPNKPCWCPSGQTRSSFRINEANACRGENLPKTNFDEQKIEQYVQFNDLSVEEEEDFKDRANNNELTVEELKILDSILIDKQQPKVDEGPICRKKGCPYYKCYRKKNCTCC